MASNMFVGDAEIIGIDLDDGFVFRADNVRGRIDHMVALDGSQATNPGDASAIMVQWENDGSWSVVPCEFTLIDVVMETMH